MIARCEIQCKIEDYYQYERILNQLGTSNESNTFHVSRQYANKGLLKICTGCVEKSFIRKPKNKWRRARHLHLIFYYLTITIDPAHVVAGTYDPLALFDPRDYACLVTRFDRLISEILVTDLPSLSRWQVRSIEYVADIAIPNLIKNNVSMKQYMNLVKQGFAPESMIERHVLTEYHVINNGSATLRIYPLQNELRLHGCKAPDILAQAEKYIRFEIKCERRKLTSIGKKYGYKGRPVPFCIGKRLDIILVRTYLRKIISDDDYFSIRQAVRRLNACDCLNRQSRTGCREMLQAVAIAGGISYARKKWKQLQDNVIPVRVKNKRSNVRLPDYKLYRRLKQLKQAGINPVPIPESWKIGHISNPFAPLYHELERWSIDDLPQERVVSRKTNTIACTVFDENNFVEDGLLADW